MTRVTDPPSLAVMTESVGNAETFFLRFSAVATGGWGRGGHGDLQTFGCQNRCWKCAKKHCKLRENLLLAHVCGDAFA